VKGIGYALEAMMATVILLLFSLSAVQVSSPDQDWSQYQKEVAAQDLTYSMQSSGKLEKYIRTGELGSFQDAVTTVSDTGMEASGIVSELPLYEFSIGYFVRPENREIQGLEEVSPGNQCYGQLSELEDSVDNPEEYPIYQSDGSAPESDYNVTLYFGNTNPTGVDSTRDSYETLWVDNGTACQFAEDDGPFYEEQIFFWGDRNEDDFGEDYFSFEDIDVDTAAEDGESEFYKATQAYNIKSEMAKGVNNISTDISLDMVDFEEIESEDHDALVFAERESLTQINSGDNMDLVEDHLVSGSVLLLMNPVEGDMDEGLLEEANLEWIETDYQDGYSGDELTGAAFSSERDSIDLETLYQGQKGEVSDLELRPPGKVVSNSSRRLEAGRTLYSPSEAYDFSEWDVYEDDFDQVDPADVDGAPDSNCYEEGTASSSLTEAENVDFEDTSSDVNVLNAEVGDCTGNRALKFDFDNSGSYEGSSVYLNGESFVLEGREYFIDIAGACSDSDDGECVDFIVSGEDSVELMPHTGSFDSFPGSSGDLALLGYSSEYSDEQNKVIASALHWVAGGTNTFEGLDDPSGIDTSAKGSVDEEVYMPYELDLRWSQ